MRVVSVNTGKSRDIEWRGRLVRTAIFKSPVAGPVRVQDDHLDGDEQADPTVHGGHNKAVYAYPSEHYAGWRRELPDAALEWGAFGENLTTEGLLESAVCAGDRLRIGTAEFIVTQPRLPCFKLSVRFGRPDMVRLFAASARTGFYLAVRTVGTVAAGDAIEWLPGDEPRIAVAELAQRALERAAGE